MGWSGEMGEGEVKHCYNPRGYQKAPRKSSMGSWRETLGALVAQQGTERLRFGLENALACSGAARYLDGEQNLGLGVGRALPWWALISLDLSSSRSCLEKNWKPSHRLFNPFSPRLITVATNDQSRRTIIGLCT